DEKFDKMLHLIIDENILKFGYLNKLQPDIPKEERNLQTIELFENIANDISDKIFDTDIISSVKKFLPEYINYLYEKFKKQPHSDELVNKFKGIAFQNIINLKLDDFDRIKREKIILTSILRNFPKYTILDEIDEKLKKKNNN
ncbi:MAG: hypothetical protein JSV62_10010, partial [Promethearchaeota archaeon]